MDYDPVTDTLSDNKPLSVYGNTYANGTWFNKKVKGMYNDNMYAYDDWDGGMYDYDTETFKPLSKTNPSGTAELLQDLVYATDDEIYDSISELQQLKNNKKKGNK